MNMQRYGEISIVTLPPLRVASYRVVSDSPEEEGLEFIRRWFDDQGVSAAPRKFGFDADVTPEQQAAGMRGYEQWWTVPDDVQPSSGVEIKDFPGGLYALMTVHNAFENPFAFIPAGWERLHAWVEQSGSYRGAAHQWLEELVPGEGSSASESTASESGASESDLRLYHPVEAV